MTHLLGELGCDVQVDGRDITINTTDTSAVHALASSGLCLLLPAALAAVVGIATAAQSAAVRGSSSIASVGAVPRRLRVT